MNKQDIAQRQIHGAIRVYFLAGDPIVIASLAAPASQILRDLNKNNRRAMSNVLTELALEHNVPPGRLWSEFNDNTANILKHARDPGETIDFEKFANHDMQVGAIGFCIFEYYANTGGITRYMEAFGRYGMRRKKRLNVEKWPRSLLDSVDRRITLLRLDIDSAIWRWILNILTRAKRRLDDRKTARLG